MSVFDLPRLHFGGTAVTRLPTGPRSGLLDQATNRALTDDGPFPVHRPAAEYHAYLDRRGTRFDEAGRPAPDGVFGTAKGWNFGGNGHFWVDAVVVGAEGPDGPVDADPVVGRAVDMWGHYNEYLATTANRARVFDVDPASDWTTTLMVGQFCFGRSGRSHVTGYMAAGTVSGMHPPRWHNPAHVVDAGPHVLDRELRRSAVYQFVVAAADGLAWLDEAAASPVVTRLRSVVDSGAAAGLVVQFALTTMAPPTVPDTPDRWNLRGTIAPWRPDELRSYPAGRLLSPRAAGRTTRPAALHTATVEVRGGRATLNLVSAVPVHRRGTGQPERCDAGDLELRTARTDRLVARVPRSAYRGPEFDRTGGIVTVPAEPPGADDEGLVLVGTADDGRRTVLLAEEEVNLQTDDAALFLEQGEPGDEQAAEVCVRSYVRGRPAPVDGAHVRQFVNPRSRPLDPGDADIVGVRPGRLDVPGDFGAACTLSTDADGIGWVTVRGARAGAGRLLLAPDGGELPAGYDNDDELGYWAAAGSAAVRVLPDDRHLDRVPTEEVTFDLVYREVFAYYELLYSFMSAEVFSLADECKVKTYPRLIWQMCDPANRGKTYYMPPTRDLSQPKARLLLRFLRAQQQVSDVPVVVPEPRVSDRITTRGQLWSALKCGATIELAVMLQYLYAAYSVPAYGAGEEYVRRGLWTPEQLRLACGDGGRTRDGGIRGTLLGIAREEMIHFLIVNNIIMAMGEPFHVPDVDFGTINNTLPVPLDFALEPLGVGSVQRFIAIEQPEDQVGEIHPPLAERLRAGRRAPLRLAQRAVRRHPRGPATGPRRLHDRQGPRRRRASPVPARVHQREAPRLPAPGGRPEQRAVRDRRRHGAGRGEQAGRRGAGRRLALRPVPARVRPAHGGADGRHPGAAAAVDARVSGAAQPHPDGGQREPGTGLRPRRPGGHAAVQPLVLHDVPADGAALRAHSGREPAPVVPDELGDRRDDRHAEPARRAAGHHAVGAPGPDRRAVLRAAGAAAVQLAAGRRDALRRAALRAPGGGRAQVRPRAGAGARHVVLLRRALPRAGRHLRPGPVRSDDAADPRAVRRHGSAGGRGPLPALPALPRAGSGAPGAAVRARRAGDVAPVPLRRRRRGVVQPALRAQRGGGTAGVGPRAAAHPGRPPRAARRGGQLARLPGPAAAHPAARCRHPVLHRPHRGGVAAPDRRAGR
nr:EspD-like indole-3-pyruvic acid imine synthase [uncultured bacterium]